jgi:hypothetical protein
MKETAEQVMSKSVIHNYMVTSGTHHQNQILEFLSYK